MIVLDTDSVSILQWQGEPAERLRRRMNESDDSWLGTTVITLEEQSKAAITRLGRSKSTHEQVKYYDLLASIFRFFGKWKVAKFDEAAASKFDQLRSQKVRIGRSDLKIAAIALVNDAVLVTANTRDFEQVPNLRFENWLK